MTLEALRSHIAQYSHSIRKKWWFIAIIALLFAALTWGYSHTKETLFTSTTTFLPEKGSTKTASFDPIASLLGGGGSSSGSDEISGVLKSRYLSEQIAADSMVFRGERQLVADATLTYFLVDRFSWSQLFKASPDVKAIDYDQKIISAGVMISSSLRIFTDEFNFLQMRFTFGEPQIVEEVSKLAIEELQDYLIRQRTVKDSLNYRFFQAKSDSVRKIIESNAKYIARFADRARYSTRTIDRLEAEKRELENQSLIQILKQYELSRENAISQIQKNTPTINVLDAPKPPFDVLAPNKVIHFVIGLILGVILASIWVTRRIWKKDIIEAVEKALS